MNEMSLEEQIQCMQIMRGKLQDFCNDMNRSMENFHDDIQTLRMLGFSIETETRYLNGYYTPAKDTVDEVVLFIQRDHFDYIDRVIDRLQRALNEQ